MYSFQSSWRCDSCRYHFRKYCNTDRCNFYLQAARCQQMACSIAANRRQHSDRTFRSLLRIWCKSSDPADDADRRCRRSHFLRNLRNDRSYRTFQSKKGSVFEKQVTVNSDFLGSCCFFSSYTSYKTYCLFHPLCEFLSFSNILFSILDTCTCDIPRTSATCVWVISRKYLI